MPLQTTMNIYGKAMTNSKRQAPKVVVLNSSKNVKPTTTKAAAAIGD